jgi:tryptophan-rich sensory protein
VTSSAPTLTWCALVLVFAVLANTWNGHDPGWYDGLRRPSLQPPDVAFAVMWPLNFALLLLVGLTVVRTAPPAPAWTATGALALSVALALGWAWAFYVPHALAAAAACLAGATVLTWLLVVVVGRIELWGALTLLPYAGWLTVATALAVSYARSD